MCVHIGKKGEGQVYLSQGHKGTNAAEHFSDVMRRRCRTISNFLSWGLLLSNHYTVIPAHKTLAVGAGDILRGCKYYNQ